MFGFKTKLVTGALVLALSAGFSWAESKVGSTKESRILLGFSMPDDGVREMLPEGWQPFTLPKGPIAGTNVILAMIDRHLILDADGKPEAVSSGPTVAMLAYATKEGVKGVRGYVVRVFEEAPLVDPYGVSVPANIDRVSAFSDMGGGVRHQSEAWVIEPEAGGRIAVDLDFDVGGMMWSEGSESRPYSAANPDFHRIYRYDQLLGVAMSDAMGRPLAGEVTVTSTDPKLAGLFDGSEKLVAVLAIPVYLREISLP